MKLYAFHCRSTCEEALQARNLAFIADMLAVPNIIMHTNPSAWSDEQCPHSKNTMHCPPHAGPHSFVNISTTNGEQL
jgi:hypothetical protein